MRQMAPEDTDIHCLSHILGRLLYKHIILYCIYYYYHYYHRQLL